MRKHLPLYSHKYNVYVCALSVCKLHVFVLFKFCCFLQQINEVFNYGNAVQINCPASVLNSTAITANSRAQRAPTHSTLVA